MVGVGQLVGSGVGRVGDGGQQDDQFPGPAAVPVGYVVLDDPSQMRHRQGPVLPPARRRPTPPVSPCFRATPPPPPPPPNTPPRRRSAPGPGPSAAIAAVGPASPATGPQHRWKISGNTLRPNRFRAWLIPPE